MTKFTSQYAQQLLRAHEPHQRAYLCSEIGLDANAENIGLLDAAYAELVVLGYVEETPEQTATLYTGGVPKHLFRLTNAGLDAKAKNIAESANE